MWIKFSIPCVVLSLFIGGVDSVALALDTSMYHCTAYTATKKLVKKNSAGQHYLDITGAQKDADYAKICFTNDSIEISDQLIIDNTATTPLLIENLTVRQAVTPSQCSATASHCPSVIIKGTAPVILRNPKIEVTSGISLPTVDGLAIDGANVTIEVTPDKVADANYVTVKDFRYGIFTDTPTSRVTLDHVKVQRTTAQVGSAGVYLRAGTGHMLTDVQTQCAQTGVALWGGTETAPNLVLGGTFSGKYGATDCTAHTGLFFQGSHVFAHEAEGHPLSITNFQHGVILDPHDGPMGIEGGTIANAEVGVKVTKNAMNGSQLQVWPTEFKKVKEMHVAEKPLTDSLDAVQLAKQCKNTMTVSNNTVCDAQAASNEVVSIIGSVPSLYCSSNQNMVLLYADAEAKAMTLNAEHFPHLISSCMVQPLEDQITVAEDAELATQLEKGACGFRCVQSKEGNPLTIPLANSVIWPVLVTSEGAYPMGEALQLAMLGDWFASPGVVMATPIGGAPGVTGESESNDGGLDALAGGDEPAGGLDGSDGGTSLGGTGGSDELGNSDQLGDAKGGYQSDPSGGDADDPDTDSDSTDQQAPAQVFAGGGMDGGGSTEGAPGIAAAGVGGGCSLILVR